MSDAMKDLEELFDEPGQDGIDREELERLEELVGEVTAVLSETSEDQIPAALKQRLVHQGEVAVAAASTTQVASGPKLESDGPKNPSPAGRQSGLMAWSGWAVAAIVSALWLGGVGSADPPQQPSASEIRAQLLQDVQDAVEVSWTATEDPAATGATGDVVWSNRTQSGVMRFAGLEANDPTQFRYQLWIFDASRDERYPVDGGLFDMAEGAAEVLVPVDARLMVGEPTLFAVTVERSDGVVVSDRERIVVVAQMTDLTQAGQ